MRLRPPSTIRTFSLLEVLLAGMLGFGLASYAVTVSLQTLKSAEASLHEVWLNQDLSGLRRDWRSFCHAPGATGVWRRDGAALVLGTQRAEVRGNQLLLTSARGTRAVGIPQRVTAVLALDSEAGQPPCARLELAWQTRDIGKPRPQFINLAACPQETKP